MKGMFVLHNLKQLVLFLFSLSIVISSCKETDSSLNTVELHEAKAKPVYTEYTSIHNGFIQGFAEQKGFEIGRPLLNY